jgi:proline dehydrogenase
MIPPIASKFVAGETPAAALDHARRLDDRDIGAILNLLGEHYDDPDAAATDRDAYLDLIDDIASANGDICISIKPSQIGLDIDEAVFRENLEAIVERAEDRDVFVWMDMEDHTTTDTTLDAFEDFAREYDGDVGLCLQANLKRTRDDVERLADVPGKIRLVKGAYDEPEEIAYTEKSRVNEAYRDLLEYAFERYDGGIAVGSHDPEMIDYARDLHAEHGTEFEVQMLMGVREDAQDALAEEYEVWQYVPYGDKWLSYFYRRAMERKENLLFALRAVVSG